MEGKEPAPRRVGATRPVTALLYDGNFEEVQGLLNLDEFVLAIQLDAAGPVLRALTTGQKAIPPWSTRRAVMYGSKRVAGVLKEFGLWNSEEVKTITEDDLCVNWRRGHEADWAKKVKAKL